jgi:hypothetical protein
MSRHNFVMFDGTFSLLLTEDCQVPSQQITSRLPHGLSSAILRVKKKKVLLRIAHDGWRTDSVSYKHGRETPTHHQGSD